MVEIHQLNSTEAEIVNDLAHRIWPEAFKTILKPDQIRYMLDWMYDVNTLQEQIETGQVFYVLREFGQPKGFIGLEPNYPDAGILRIHKLYVLPNSHGKGFGRELLNKAIDLAFDLDQHTLHLNVNRFNKATEFYKHTGFSIIGEEDIEIGKGYLMEDYIMSLQLRDPKNYETSI